MSTAKHVAEITDPVTATRSPMMRRIAPEVAAMADDKGRATYWSTGLVRSGNSKTASNIANRSRNFQRLLIVLRHPDPEHSEGEGFQTQPAEILRRLRGSG